MRRSPLAVALPLVALFMLLGPTAAFAATAPCPTSTMSLSVTNRATRAAADDTLIDLPSGQVGGYFDLARDTLRASAMIYNDASALSADVTLRERYELTGPPPGTPINFQIRIPILGFFHVYPGVPQGYSETIGTIAVDGVTVDSLGGGGGCCHGDYSEALLANVTEPAGTTFEIAVRLLSYVSSNAASNAVGAGLHIEGLPAGVTVHTCHGDSTGLASTTSPPPPTALRIDSVWPNPARDRIAIAFAVPRGGPVVLQLLDIAGRIIEARLLDAPAAALRTATFGEQARLAPGAYFVRLSQGALSAARQVSIVR